MKDNKIRNSNIELLRITAMIMIIVAHVVHNGIRYQLVDKTSIVRMSNDFFCKPFFFKRLFLVAGLLPLGNIANAIFILITGYFMVEKGKNIRLGEISKKICLQVGYAALLRVVIPLLYYSVNKPDNNSIISMGSINEFNSVWWFPGYYLAVVVLGYFLNGYLETINRDTYRNILLIIFGLFSLGWSGGILNSIAEGLRTLVCGVFFYALGGFMKRYNPFGKIRTWVLFVLIIISYGLVYLSYYSTVKNGIQRYLTTNGTDSFIQPMYYVDNFSIVVVVIGVVMLELFSRLKVPNNRIVNLIASGSLMVYLLHGHGFWIALVQEHDWVKSLFCSPKVFCMEVIEWTGVTFVIAIVGYLIYLGLNQICKKCRFLVLISKEVTPRENNSL